MNSRQVKAVLFFGILCITIIRCFNFSWEAPPQRWDEQTNIQVIYELQYSDNPLLLTYNRMPFYEKPPIWYALTAYISTITHTSPLVAARLISATCGFFIILLSFIVAQRFWGFSAGVIAWSVLISTNHLFETNPYSIFSTHTIHSADSDILFMLLMLSISVLCVSTFISRKLAVIIGALTAIAILIKGPLALVPIVIATIIPHLSWSQKHNSNIWISWICAGLISSVWILYMIVTFGYPFVYEHIGYHIFLRATTPIENHSGPMLFYVQLLFLKPLFLFFEVYIVSLIVYIQSKTQMADPRIMHVCVASMLLICIPSLAQTKLAWYILPFYPYAALTIAGIVTTTKAFRIFSAKWI